MTLTERARWLNWRSGRSDLPFAILMSDEERLPDPCDAAMRLPAGSAVLVRHRDADARRALALRLRPIVRSRHLALIVADDLPLAEEIGADGLHLPEAHAATVDALSLRRRWHGLLSCAAHSPRAIRRAEAIGADAVLVSPVFATASHPGLSTIGPLRLAVWARATRMPIYALGGLSASNAGRLAGRNLVGIAGIGGFSDGS